MILGFIEHDRGKLNELSLEMLTLGRDLAQKLDAPRTAVLIGHQAAALAGAVAAYGVSKAYLVQDERLDEYAPAAWAHCVVQLIQSEEPQVVMAPGTDRGSEVLAHVAARLDLPLAANCAEVYPGEPYRVTRLRWGGSLLEEAYLEGNPRLLTVAPHTIPATPAAADGQITVSTWSPALDDADFVVRVVDRVQTAADRISLTDARVVVGGGRGVGSAEGFATLEELAGLIGAAVGGSRVVTNLGWRPHSDQIGQTGTRIAPDLYIACGISGAIQHMVGAKGSKRILVINTDREAPIISKADYFALGDLHEIVTAVIAEIKKAQGNQDVSE